jgi:hypothetical protein
MYALLLLLLLVCVWAMLRLLQTGSAATQVTYVVSAALAMYTHTFAAFALLAINLFYALRWIRGGPTGVPLRRWVTLNAAVVVLFGPWIPATREVAQMGLPWIIRPPAPHEAIAGYAGGVVAAVVAGFLCAIALWRGWREKDDRAGLLALLIIVPVVGPWLYGPFSIRYGIVALLGLAILCAYVAAWMGRIACGALVILAAANWMISSDLGHPRYPGFTYKRDVRSAAASVRERAGPSDGLNAASSPYLRHSLEYYLRDVPLKWTDDLASPAAPPRVFLTAPDSAAAQAAVAGSGYAIAFEQAFEGIVLLELRRSEAAAR